MKLLTDTAKTADRGVAYCLTDDGIVTLSGLERHRRVYGVDTTDLSITRHIPSTELNGEDIFVLAYLSYLYTLRLADTRMMRRLTKVDRKVVTQTKDNVFMSPDMVKYKIATLRCVVQQLTPNDYKQVEKHFVECGLNRVDAILYYLLYDNNDVQEFIKQIALIEDLKFSLSVDVLSRELDKNPKNFHEFEKTATYFTRSKLLFICHGNRFDFNDLKHDLIERAVQAYYWVRPFYNVLHAVNYAKSAIRGFQNCLIEYYNEEDRRRTFADSESPTGYSNVIRDYTDDVLAKASINETENAMLEYLDYMRSNKQ